MALYLIPNGAAPGAAAPVAVTTGSAIKTMLQVKPSATIVAKIVEWGISFDGSAAATPIKVELVETSGAATVTASVAADITKLDGNALAGGDPTTNLIPVGTTSTGYTASGEGTPGTCRIFDLQYIAPTNQYVKQFPLGREPVIQVSTFARIRVTAGAAVNAYCYVIIEI
jgi:hypothetical protein